MAAVPLPWHHAIAPTFLSQQILEGQGLASTGEVTENKKSLCVVYQRCPDCRHSTVFTEDGSVEILLKVSIGRYQWQELPLFVPKKRMSWERFHLLGQ